jgi:hypothetical protein
MKRNAPSSQRISMPQKRRREDKMPAKLTPMQENFVRSLAETYELRAWNAPPFDQKPAPGSLPHNGHVMHALALRIALGQSAEESHAALMLARGGYMAMQGKPTPPAPTPEIDAGHAARRNQDSSDLDRQAISLESLSAPAWRVRRFRSFFGRA